MSGWIWGWVNSEWGSKASPYSAARSCRRSQTPTFIRRRWSSHQAFYKSDSPLLLLSRYGCLWGSPLNGALPNTEQMSEPAGGNIYHKPFLENMSLLHKVLQLYASRPHLYRLFSRSKSAALGLRPSAFFFQTSIHLTIVCLPSFSLWFCATQGTVYSSNAGSSGHLLFRRQPIDLWCWCFWFFFLVFFTSSVDTTTQHIITLNVKTKSVM